MSGKIKITPLLTALFSILISATAFADTTAYQYDDLHRLTQVARADGTVTVYHYDDFGNRTSKLVTVPSNSPVAQFTSNQQYGNSPLPVIFTDQSTGNITSWEWDFDNNSTVDSTAQNPTYIYNVANTYTVKLTVSGPDGSDPEIKINYITVTDPNTDSDGDDLPDWWEEQYFLGDLTVLNRNGDHDNDGYSNYQEYLNGTNPTVKDPPPGYHPPSSKTLPAILMMLLDKG